MKATPYKWRDPSELVRKPFKHLHRWGPWVLDTKRIVLCYCPDSAGDPLCNFYEVDIESINTAWDVLDWICQISHKCLANTYREDMPNVVGHLAMALDDLFAPQNRMRDGQSAPALVDIE